jgi:hypothetical protein
VNWGELVPLALRKQLPLLSARLGLASKAGSANSRLHISTNDHNLTCVLIKKKRKAIAVRVAEACGNAACAVCRACSAHLRASMAAHAKGLMVLARLPMQRTHSYVASEAMRRAATLQRCALDLRSAPAGLTAWWCEEQRLRSSAAASRACWGFSCAASEVLRRAAMLRGAACLARRSQSAHLEPDGLAA